MSEKTTDDVARYTPDHAACGTPTGDMTFDPLGGWVKYDDHIARLRELQAVVDRLPKTADGVPIGLGQNVYRPHVTGPVCCGFINLRIDEDSDGRVFGTTRDEDGAERGCYADEVFSTCAAALAARDNERKETT